MHSVLGVLGVSLVVHEFRQEFVRVGSGVCVSVVISGVGILRWRFTHNVLPLLLHTKLVGFSGSTPSFHIANTTMVRTRSKSYRHDGSPATNQTHEATGETTEEEEETEAGTPDQPVQPVMRRKEDWLSMRAGNLHRMKSQGDNLFVQYVCKFCYGKKSKRVYISVEEYFDAECADGQDPYHLLDDLCSKHMCSDDVERYFHDDDKLIPSSRKRREMREHHENKHLITREDGRKQGPAMHFAYGLQVTKVPENIEEDADVRKFYLKTRYKKFKTMKERVEQGQATAEEIEFVERQKSHQNKYREKKKNQDVLE